MTRHVTLALLLALAAPAVADTPTEKPWYAGVSAEAQAQAQALFEEGNVFFTERSLAQALEKYLAALALWDHPLIRFNRAVTEIRLERWLDAADSLDLALRFGAAPFTENLYAQAQDYQALLGQQLGNVEVTCDQADVEVTLDGRPWFRCPGTQRTRILAGEHTIVGELDRYLTFARRVTVVGGAAVSERVTLVPLDSAVVVTYRYPRWMPYTVAGAGVALGLVGFGVWNAGRNQMRDFDENFKQACSTTGCESDLSDHPLLAEQRDSARFKGSMGIATMTVGGAALVAGVVLTVLNRPRRSLPTVEVAPRGDGAEAGLRWTF